MKVRIAQLVVLATVMMSQLGFAATSSMFVDVPFDFSADNVDMPSGRYLVSRISDNTIALQLENGAKSLFCLTNAKERLTPVDLGELVFDKAGSRYFLAEVWERNSGTGRVLHKTKTEKMAQRQENTEQVALAAASK